MCQRPLLVTTIAAALGTSLLQREVVLRIPSRGKHLESSPAMETGCGTTQLTPGQIRVMPGTRVVDLGQSRIAAGDAISWR